jgi:hypothetical protein
MLALILKDMTRRIMRVEPRRIIAGLLFSLSLAFGIIGPAQAAASTTLTSGANGFLVSPVISELTINKGQSQTVAVAVQNPTNLPTTAQAIVNDFVASADESGTPRLILNNNSPLPPNNFKALVSPIPTISLSPQEKQYINVTITVPSTAHAGGYYGAVRFAPITSSNQSNVGLTASVGTLFLVTVPGNLIEKLDLVQLSAAHGSTPTSLFTSGAVSVLTRLDNVGDIHVQPFGNVIVKNMFGHVVANYQFNNTTPRTNILPDSIRRYVDKLSTKNHWLGHYTIDENLAYSQGSGNLIVASASFWYLPWWFIGLFILFVIIIVAIVWWLIRRHHRRHPQHAPHNPTTLPPAQI